MISRLGQYQAYHSRLEQLHVRGLSSRRVVNERDTRSNVCCAIGLLLERGLVIGIPLLLAHIS